MSHESDFITWLYNSDIPIYNGDMLVNAMENTDLQEQFISDTGLTEDTEL